MLRVGYPATISAELLRDFPPGIELIPLPDNLDHDIEIDVWIPNPYPTRAMRVWPRLRGVRLILSLMTGTEWIPAWQGRTSLSAMLMARIASPPPSGPSAPFLPC